MAWVNGGADFLNVAIKGDVIEKVTPPEKEVSERLYFYLMYMPTNLLPWFLIFLVFLLSKERWKEAAGNPLFLALFCWSIGSILIMSLIPSKRMDRMIASWPAFSILIGIYFGSEEASTGSRFAKAVFTLFGWSGAAGSVIVMLSILLNGDIRLPFLNIKEAIEIIPVTLYILIGSASLAAIVFVTGVKTKRLVPGTPVFCGISLFLLFSLYSIQQATRPLNLTQAIYCRFGCDVRQYLKEENFTGRVLIGSNERQMFWYAKVVEPKMIREALPRNESLAYVSYSSEAQFLAKKGLVPVLTSRSLPGFKRCKSFRCIFRSHVPLQRLPD